MRGVLRTALERQSLVAAWNASGLSPKAFAEREHLPPSSLYQWIADDRGRRPALRIARVVRKSAAPDRQTLVASARPSVVIQLSCARVEVAAGCDRATLANVVEILDARDRQGRP